MLSSLLGGVLGVLVVMWGIRSLTWLLANGQERFALRARLNWQVMLFNLGLALVTGALFGLAPALRSTRVSLAAALKEAQSAGLFVRTLSNLHSVSLGFNQDKMLLFLLDARQAGHKDAALARFYGDALDRFRRIPGVKSAGPAEFWLVSGYWNSSSIRIPGAPSATGEHDTCLMKVASGFLPAMQIPILLGRGFEDRNLGAPRVAVVIGLGKEDSTPADIEIIGVAQLRAEGRSAIAGSGGAQDRA